jgi:hypothetical protein
MPNNGEDRLLAASAELRTRSEALTRELLLATKDRLLAACAELRTRSADEHVLTGLQQAASELVDIIDDCSQPNAAMWGAWWRADVVWREGLRILEDMRQMERTPLEAMKAAAGILAPLKGSCASIELGVFSREQFEAMARALGGQIRVSIYDKDKGTRRHAIEVGEAHCAGFAVTWRHYREELTAEEHHKLDLEPVQNEKRASKSTSYIRSRKEAV